MLLTIVVCFESGHGRGAIANSDTQPVPLHKLQIPVINATV